MLSRRVASTLLVLLTLVLAGTVVLLGSVWSYFHLDAQAMIRPEELVLITTGRGVQPDFEAWAPDMVLSPEQAAKVRADWEATHPHGADLRPSWLEPRPVEADAAPAARVAGSGASAAAASPAASPAADAASAEPVWHAHEAIGEGHFRAGKTISYNATNGLPALRLAPGPGEQIPRIIHQTWKEGTLPERWAAVRAECEAMHPDYDYVLWTDGDSRAFIENHYPWFLETFDSYPFPIQRADAIRYFVLHHYGGVYMDLDIGCLRPMDPLLAFEVVLPETIPVGVSNDLMLAARGHPFVEQLIQQLPAFNHNYMLHYPTVMFSTGPMFVSASYSMWSDANGVALPSSTAQPTRGLRGVRILPKLLYGKNLDPKIAQARSFYKHFYGSSWHANDAGFIILLRDVGKYLFLIGLGVLFYGLLRRLGFSPWGMLRGAHALVERLRGGASRAGASPYAAAGGHSRNGSSEGLLGYTPEERVVLMSRSSSKEKAALAQMDAFGLTPLKSGAAEPRLARPLPRHDLAIYLGSAEAGSSSSGGSGDDEYFGHGNTSGSEDSLLDDDVPGGAAQYLLHPMHLRRPTLGGGRTPSPTQAFHARGAAQPQPQPQPQGHAHAPSAPAQAQAPAPGQAQPQSSLPDRRNFRSAFQ